MKPTSFKSGENLPRAGNFTGARKPWKFMFTNSLESLPLTMKMACEKIQKTKLPDRPGFDRPGSFKTKELVMKQAIKNIPGSIW